MLTEKKSEPKVKKFNYQLRVFEEKIKMMRMNLWNTKTDLLFFQIIR